MEYSDITNLHGLIPYTKRKGCTYFTKHKELCNTRILQAYFTKKDNIFYMIAKEGLPYPKNVIYRVLSVDETGQVEIVNNFLDFNDAKVEYFKHAYK
jgi:hypothetical protein